MQTTRYNVLFLFAVGLSAAAAACGGNQAAPAGGPPGGAMPPMPVEIVTLEAKPIPQTTEFVGTVKSRRSTTIQPQVEGFLTAILVKSGDRVQAGARLAEIDSRPQEAAIASLEAVKAQREIDISYARQEADRARQLLAAGAASQMEADRANNALAAAEAQARTVDEQIRQARIDLAYYHVTAPTAGIVGDIPVRVGDRVTTQTALTTIEANEGLELYINVPVQQARDLRNGLPVRLLDDGGQTIAETSINFVSPSVDTATQTVLVKVPLAANSGFRTSQFVRAQIVWSTEPRLTVPVTAVTRINGQYFVFVAEAAGQGGQPLPPGTLVAHQRAVSLGAVVDNAYVVNSGVNAGEKLIVSGIQKIGEGAPVQAAPPAQTAPPGVAAPGGAGAAPAAAPASGATAPAETR
jgi:RND family efflux transporter MFP subunit